MNNNNRNDASDRPVSLNDEANPDSTAFNGAGAGAAAASNNVPDAHITPSGQKQHTKIFYSVNTKKMAKKDKIDTTPAANAPIAVPTDASA